MPRTLFANLLIFSRTLRAAGVTVRAGAVADAAEALADIGIGRRGDVRDALRTVFVCRHEDLARFDELFDRFWRSWEEPGNRSSPRPMQTPRRRTATLSMLAQSPASKTADQPQANDERTVSLQAYSPDEAWRRKDFSTFDDDDVARAKAAMKTLAWSPGERTTRRWIGGAGRAIDWRRLFRANMRHGGEPIAIPRRARRIAPRPLILMCDISGSMEPYTRMLLLFAHAIAGGERRVEVFVFSTELTRVTRHFAHRRADTAVARVQDAVRDWSGGTRIGEAVHRFNADWARRVLRREPVVLLISDGWDLGDTELLRREMARLQRSAFRLIWLNPLLGSPGYEPLTRGMRAALPFVDDFLPVHDMSSIESLAAHLNGLSDARAGHRRSA
jgi:uncharacterized protein with von Willebrand factor type A (vWA) domain